jgi:hypothetical protein
MVTVESVTTLNGCAMGEVPVTDIKKLKYADLRPALIDSYVTLGNKSLKERADGTENIAGLAALDEFCEFKQKVDDGKIIVTDRGLSATQLTTDFASRFVRKRKAEDGQCCNQPRSLAALRRMLKLAKRAKKIHDVPFIEFLKEPSARKGFLTVSEFDELIGLLPTHLRPLVTRSTTAELESVRRCSSNGRRSTLTPAQFDWNRSRPQMKSASCHCRLHS